MIPDLWTNPSNPIALPTLAVIRDMNSKPNSEPLLLAWNLAKCVGAP